MAESLDSKLEENIPDELKSIDAEVKRTEKELTERMEKPRSFLGKVWDAARIGAFWYAQSVMLPATLFYTTFIPCFGFWLSKYRGEKKAGRKMTWRKTIKALAFGQAMGWADVAVFSLPSMIPKLSPALFSTGKAYRFAKYNWLKKILAGTAKTLIFNPFAMIPYNFAYNVLNYFQNRRGMTGLLKPHNWGKYMRHMYHTDWKGKWKEDSKNIFKYLFGLHWIQNNLHHNVQTRLLQSLLINNKIYADQMAKKGYENVVQMNSYNQPQYSDNYQQGKAAA
ncbi:hypothetical protein JXA85_01125 [Candidatus Woesearchaeota archaeon]|nr:hypothetical protein [Candidatus Woesearchaeota archaeon]